MRKHVTAVWWRGGGLGTPPPPPPSFPHIKLLEFRGYEITSETRTMLLRDQTTEFHMNTLPFLYCTRLSNRLLILQATLFADEACGTNHSLGSPKSCYEKRFFRTACSHLAYKFQHVASQCTLCAWSLCVGIY